MAVATDISQELSRIQSAAAALEKSAEDQKNKIQSLVNDMTKAMNEKNRPMIERDLQTLGKLKLPPYANLLAATNTLLGQLKQLEPEDNSDDLKKVNALTTSLGELQGKLELNFAKLKTLEDAANKALAQSAQDGSKAADEWAAMENELNKQLQVAKTRLEAMRALEDLADAAVKDGDQADLDAAIKKSAVRATWKPTAKEITAKFSTFCTKCASQGLSKELQDQLTRDRARFQKIVDQIVETNELMDNLLKSRRVGKECRSR